MREKVEDNQVIIYALTIIVAIIFGIYLPQSGHVLGAFIPVTLGILMYGMFSQIPFFRLKEALKNKKFISALLVTNYICIPLLVWVLIQFLPQNHAVILGVLLVLLTPCIDYVIVFTKIGKGNAELILVSTPLLFISQMCLLPLYLWLFLDHQVSAIISIAPFVDAFISLILIPLILAVATQWYVEKNRFGNQLNQVVAWIPVPFMALVLFFIIASQIGKIIISMNVIIYVIPIYAAYMLFSFIIARFVAKGFKLDIFSSRALIFSAGTRNSLVVLPFALALPSDVSTIVAAVIVTQTIVELVGELIYVRVTPKLKA